MTYSYLAAWAKEFVSYGLKVESVYTHSDGLTISFKNGMELCLILSAGNGFPFLRQRSPLPDANTHIWQQLTHSELVSTVISSTDRVISFIFRQIDIYQQSQVYHLIAEFTPPKPNVIFAAGTEGLVVLDAIHKYSYADNPQRQILPKLPYQPAKTSFKPQLEQIAFPLVIEPPDGSAPIVCANANEYFINYYSLVYKAKQEREAHDKAEIHWRKELAKAHKKLSKQIEELSVAEQAEHWKTCVELMKINLRDIVPGQAAIKVTNYYDPELKLIEIPLKVDRSPRQNLQDYVRKYQKAVRGGEIIRANIEETERTITSLESILQRLERGEFVDYIQDRSLASVGHKLNILDKLLKLRISDDFEIVVGRKAKENDFITTQLAQPHDWWFHTRIYRGSHILLRCFKKTAPGQELVNLCCSLAAWYSKARFSQNVPVDYTQIRFVRKPRKSAPGYVVYTKHQTVFADPLDLRAVRERLQK